MRTVRQANTKGDHLFSPFIDVKHRTLQSIAQATISEGEEHNEPIRDTTSKPSRLALTEKQVAFILFTLTVLNRYTSLMIFNKGITLYYEI